MKKLIDILIPVSLGLFVGLLISVALAKAEPPNFDQYGYRSPPPQQQQQKSNVNSALDDLLGIFLQNGLSGAIIVCLGFWTFRTDRLNRAMQKENIDKFVEISQECSSHMASVSARLENLEREVEAAKAMEQMMSMKRS